MKSRRLTRSRWLFVLVLVAQLACGGLLSDDSGGGSGPSGSARPAPHFRPGFNLFSPEQDVELGRQSAQEIAQQVPLMNDAQTVNYVRQLGAKLASKAPGHNFPYQFNVVATRDINAFALPGGFIFVNAGALAAARNEGELAGVMAHEISHVALRHGTNQASKAYVARAGIGILGSIAGGESTDLGNIIATIGGAGANVVFLKFGRTAETQADLEGARIMAAAGYDPRDMAGFFETLQRQGGQRVPEMLSDHPDPGNRVAAISQEMRNISLSPNPVRDTQEFRQIKSRITGGGAMSGSKEPARVGPRDPDDNEAGTRPQPPATTFREYRSRDGSFAFGYPENWDALGAQGDDSNLILAPKGAYGRKDESVYATHGVFIGVMPAQASDLEAANAAFVEEQLRVNPDFRARRQPERINFGDRQGFATIVAGPSPVTGVVEVDVIYTTATADGRLFYLITMAPEDEFGTYQPAFEQIIRSVRLAR